MADSAVTERKIGTKVISRPLLCRDTEDTARLRSTTRQTVAKSGPLLPTALDGSQRRRECGRLPPAQCHLLEPFQHSTPAWLMYRALCTLTISTRRCLCSSSTSSSSISARGRRTLLILAVSRLARTSTCTRDRPTRASTPGIALTRIRAADLGRAPTRIRVG